MSYYYGSIKKEHLLGALEEFKKTTAEKIEYNKWRNFVKFVKEELEDGCFYYFEVEGDIKFTIYTLKRTSDTIAGSKHLMDIILDWADSWNKNDSINTPVCKTNIEVELPEDMASILAKIPVSSITFDKDSHLGVDVASCSDWCNTTPLTFDYSSTNASPPIYNFTTATSAPTINYSTTTGTTTRFTEAFDNISTATDTLTKRVEDLEMKVKDTYVNDKENKTMDIMKNFEFGKLINPAVRLSMYGIAVKNSTSTWVSYDTNTGDIIDVDVFNFDTGSFLYQMPVAVKQIKTGDTIIHNRKPCFVVGFAEDTGNPIVIDVMAGERKEILPTKNMFGFNFVVKIVNLMNGMFGDVKPNADNPFGSMLPFLMMGDNTKMDDVLPMMLMMNGNTMDNPMLMYAMMKGDSKDMLPFLMMMNQGKNCGCHRQGNNE